MITRAALLAACVSSAIGFVCGFFVASLVEPPPRVQVVGPCVFGYAFDGGEGVR